MGTIKKIRIGISACLIGKKVRYDGGDKEDHFIENKLGKSVILVPICPEVEAGLSVPREPMQLEEEPNSPRLMTVETRIDKTEVIKKWIRYKIKELSKSDICGFIFKSGSPSCGIRDVRIYNLKTGGVKTGRGLFADAFIKTFPHIPVEDEKGLQEHHMIERFLLKISSYHLHKETLKRKISTSE